MSDCTCNGAAILSGNLYVQRVGNWTFEGDIDTDTPPTGRVVLDFFGDTWNGTVLRSGEHAGRVSVIVVGGGGVTKQIEGKSYAQGIPLSLPLQEILSAAGEVLGSAPPTIAIAGFTRFKGEAARALSQLLENRGLDWRVQPDGKVWVGSETWPAAEEHEYTIITEKPAEHRAVIAGDRALPLPGTVFMGQHVSTVEHTLTPKSWRTSVTFEDEDTGGATEDKMRQAFVSLIEDTMRGVDWLARYTGRVVAMKADGTVDVMMDDERFGPNGLNAKVRFLPGCEVQLAQGATVLIGFENGDSALPFCEPWGAGSLLQLILKAEVIEFQAPSIKIGGLASTVTIGGGAVPVALVGDLVPQSPGPVSANPAFAATRGKVLA